MSGLRRSWVISSQSKSKMKVGWQAEKQSISMCLLSAGTWFYPRDLQSINLKKSEPMLQKHRVKVSKWEQSTV
jgi:hypothetical protein